jgi:uncharacterized protein YjbJ (UPF0337 family)
MNSDQLKGQWTQFKGKIKEKWGQLTDDELDEIDGRLEVLEGKLQEKYGYSRERTKSELDDFLFRKTG